MRKTRSKKNKAQTDINTNLKKKNNMVKREFTGKVD